MIRRLGCLIVLGLIAYALWATRSTWSDYVPTVTWHHRGRHGGSHPQADSTWQSLTPHGVDRADQTLAHLTGTLAPAYVSMGPGDFAAFAMMDVAGKLPSNNDSAAVRAQNGTIELRMLVDFSHLDSSGLSLGPLSALLRGRQWVNLTGTLDVVRSGVAELRVQSLEIHHVEIPQTLIPTLIHRVEHGGHPSGVANDGILLNVPTAVADIRVAKGAVLVYRNPA